MRVHYFIWLSVRVEFKFEFEFKLVECGLKRKEERRKEPNLNPAQTPTGPISIQQPNTYPKPTPNSTRAQPAQ